MRTESYNRIAGEYYDTVHITSRNFDVATEYACAHRTFPIPKEGLILEVGAGRGCANKYCRIDPSRIIQTDFAEEMLALYPREQFLLALECDALDMPFTSSSFSAVCAFLYDPFNLTPFYFEISRVLKPGGVFIGTLPNQIWGSTLRKQLGVQISKTRFRVFHSQVEEYIDLDSFLMSDEEIARTLEDAGLSLIELADATVPDSVPNVSPHITIPADLLGVDPKSLPILKLIVARKPS
jgi:SAM-dependent methyltransferase